jgi:hypothetical protein
VANTIPYKPRPFTNSGNQAQFLRDEFQRISQALSDVKTAVQNVIPWVVAGGTSDALTATYPTPVTALTDGLLLTVRAIASNTTTTPTFNPSGIGAHTITKRGGTALVAGDITNLAELMLRYNAANTRWELVNR